MLSLLVRRGAFSVLLAGARRQRVLFLLTRSIPDSPAHIVLGQDATQAQIAQFEHDTVWIGPSWCSTAPG